MTSNDTSAPSPLVVPPLQKKSRLAADGSSELFRYVPQPQRESPSLEPVVLRLISSVHKINEFSELSAYLISSWPGFNPALRAPRGQDQPEFTDANIAGYPSLDAQARMQLAHQASECINHVRTALDYLAFNVVWADSGSRHEGTKFPLRTKAAGYAKERRDSLPGVSNEHHEWIKRVQPFNGTEWTRALVELSNRDKHRIAIDIVPSFEFTIDRSVPVRDPLGDPYYRGFSISKSTVELLLADALEATPDNPHLQADHTLRVIVAGAVNLVNLFLVDWGESEIKIEGMWVDDGVATSVIK